MLLNIHFVLVQYRSVFARDDKTGTNKKKKSLHHKKYKTTTQAQIRKTKSCILKHTTGFQPFPYPRIKVVTSRSPKQVLLMEENQ